MQGSVVLCSHKTCTASESIMLTVVVALYCPIAQWYWQHDTNTPVWCFYVWSRLRTWNFRSLHAQIFLFNRFYQGHLENKLLHAPWINKIIPTHQETTQAHDPLWCISLYQMKSGFEKEHNSLPIGRDFLKGIKVFSPNSFKNRNIPIYRKKSVTNLSVWATFGSPDWEQAHMSGQTKMIGTRGCVMVNRLLFNRHCWPTCHGQNQDGIFCTLFLNLENSCKTFVLWYIIYTFR